MELARFVGRRLAIGVPTLLVVATLSFFLLQLIPGSAAQLMLGAGATQEQIDALTAQLGLDRPALAQYADWLAGALRGDFGDSLTLNEPAIEAVLQALPATVSVALLGLAIALIVGISLGMLAALRGGVWDAMVQGFSSLMIAVPAFWLASLLIYAFAIQTPLFAATDYEPLTAGLGDWLRHVTLPALAVGLPASGQVAFQSRGAFQTALGGDYLRTLRAGGVSPARILLRHVLRNGLIPIVAFLGIMFLGMLGGVVIIETIFDLPGLGSLMVTAVNTHDLFVVQAAVVAFCVLVMLINLGADLLQAGLDPRVRV